MFVDVGSPLRGLAHPTLATLANRVDWRKKDCMISTREPVILPGILRGSGHEVACTVRATKVSLLGSHAVAYCEYSIAHTSKPLSEGNYQLSVNAETIPVRLQDGYWLSTLLS